MRSRSRTPCLRASAWLSLALWAGCQPQAMPPRAEGHAPRVTKRKTAVAKKYRLVGVVRSVDQKNGEVEIEHEAIAGYMPAMTMPFSLKDQDLVAELRPGDAVEGRLRVSATESELTDLTVTQPAPPPRMTLDVSGDVARLRPEEEVLLKPGALVPDFSVTTAEGKALSLSDLRGNVVVLTFIYTRCPLPDFCPLLDKKFAELAGKFGAVPEWGEHVRLLSVSFDPEHDTPEVLRAHALRQNAKAPLWTFAVAAHEELSKVAGPLGLKYGATPNEIIHTLSTAIIDTQGKLVRLDSGKKWDTTDFFKTIYPLVPHSRQ